MILYALVPSWLFTKMTSGYTSPTWRKAVICPSWRKRIRCLVKSALPGMRLLPCLANTGTNPLPRIPSMTSTVGI